MTSIQLLGRRARRIAMHVAALGGATAMVLGVKAAVITTLRVPSGSMEPTLRTGDWVVVYKGRRTVASKLRGVALPGPEVKRGAIVVFAASAVPLPGAPGTRFVKRVVGIGGDTVLMRNGVLFVNSRVADVRPHRWVTAGLTSSELLWMRPRTVGIEPALPLTVDSWGPLVVGRDSVFVLGDNRHTSRDSRDFGLVPVAKVEGSVTLISYAAAPGGKRAIDFSRMFRSPR